MLRDNQLELLLAEDVPFGDLTTEALGVGEQPGELTFSARDEGIACCTEEAARLFVLCGASAQVRTATGERVTRGTCLLRVTGPARSLLAAWKVAQNLVEWSSGVATATANLVRAAHQGDPAASVACTRKPFPGTRAIAVRAVRAGGGVMHRLGLSDSLLVFPEHRAFLASTAEQRLSALRGLERERRITVEVTTLEDALRFAQAGADALQLERFEPSQVAACKARLEAAGLRPLLLAAGGVNVGNAAEFARAGASVLVTSSPYQAPPANVQVLLRAT